MTAVRIENLSKTYPPSFPRLKKLLHIAVKPAVEALKNVSFEIETGEIFGLIGRNGAGKTTLTKIIATLVQPSGGRVSVKNFDSVADEVKVRALIGLATAEERSFYWRLTCEQNMMFFARLYGMNDRAARRKINELFEKLNLEELAKRRFSLLSTGNKQRLAVARALLPAPPILLLDEPTRSLDPLAAAEMRRLIASLENVSVLLTSHNLSEVEELCRRVAVISRGEIRDIDTPENLRGKHTQTQRVKITLRNLRESDLKLPPELEKLEMETGADFLRISFERNAGDRLLGEAISLLNEKGARILDVETEKPTLLDVLESYE
ncbi:MAG TPA: ABC transporter ATP-binding protein [Pyrinomonadaceae bacterium]|nr:ABC transporter ATP-binding protein [Pyrinomonadaceae bacterium]